MPTPNRPARSRGLPGNTHAHWNNRRLLGKILIPETAGSQGCLCALYGCFLSVLDRRLSSRKPTWGLLRRSRPLVSIPRTDHGWSREEWGRGPRRSFPGCCCPSNGRQHGMGVCTEPHSLRYGWRMQAQVAPNLWHLEGGHTSLQTCWKTSQLSADGQAARIERPSKELPGEQWS